MKQGRSLQSLAAELERAADSRKDYVAHQGKVEAKVVEHVTSDPSPDGGYERRNEIVLAGFNGDAYAIQPYAHKQLGDVLGIPARYYDRMRAEEPELLARNINTWLAKEPTEKRMFRTLDGRVRAVLSPRFRPLDNFELAQAVLPKLIAMNAQVLSAELTETRMYLKAILPDLSDDLPDGMTWGNGHNAIAEYGGNRAGKVVAAITISNSEVGAGTLRVEPSVFTTWCTNMAIMQSVAMKKYHVGRAAEVTENWEVFRDETREADDRAFFLKVGDVTDSAFRPEVFAAAVAQIRDATKDRITSTDIAKVVDLTVETLALPAATRSPLLSFLARGGDMSRWGLASAVTATANDLGDYETATVLERAGGTLLGMTPAQFAKIATAA